MSVKEFVDLVPVCLFKTCTGFFLEMWVVRSFQYQTFRRFGAGCTFRGNLNYLPRAEFPACGVAGTSFYSARDQNCIHKNRNSPKYKTWGSLPNFNFFYVNSQIFQQNHKIHLSNTLETNIHDIPNISLRDIRRRNYS